MDDRTQNIGRKESRRVGLTMARAFWLGFLLFSLEQRVVLSANAFSTSTSSSSNTMMPPTDRQQSSFLFPSLQGGARVAKTKFMRRMAASSPETAAVDAETEKDLSKGTKLGSKSSSAKSVGKVVSLYVAASYFCSTVMTNLPIILLPVIATETGGGSSFVARVASVASLGGAIGKFVNGFVCQGAGPKQSSSLYLLGSAACCFLVCALASPDLGLLMGGVEFFASVQWTASSVILTNHYKSDPAALAAAVTVLSLSSTAAALFTKTLGPLLLQYLSWRKVALAGGLIGVVGAATMNQIIPEAPEGVIVEKTPVEFNAILGILRRVLGNPLFWLAGIGHSFGMLSKLSDKILGSFFQDATGLSSSICGGLTISITIGLVYGLVTGSKSFFNQDSIKGKAVMLRNRYVISVFSTMALAAMGLSSITSKLSPMLVSVLIAMLSGTMASFLSFQYYQLPNVVSRAFGQDQAVCLSFLDGFGYFMASPVFAVVGQIVKGPAGWTGAWGLLAGLYIAAGGLMLSAIPSILKKEQELSS